MCYSIHGLLFASLNQKTSAAAFLDFSRHSIGAVLRPLLYPNTEDLLPEQLNPDSLATPTGIMATSLADTLREIGYGFTSS